MKKIILIISLFFISSNLFAQTGCYVTYANPTQCYDQELYVHNSDVLNVSVYGFSVGRMASKLYQCSVDYGYLYATYTGLNVSFNNCVDSFNSCADAYDSVYNDNNILIEDYNTLASDYDKALKKIKRLKAKIKRLS